MLCPPYQLKFHFFYSCINVWVRWHNKKRPGLVSVNEEDAIYVFIKASLKEFLLTDRVSPVDVAIRNHEEIEVGRSV